MKLYPFGKFTLSLPDDHKLAEIHRSHACYDRLPFEVLAAYLAAHPEGAIIDIGANVGDSAASFRSHCHHPLLCVEGAEEFLSHLHYNAPRISGGPLEIIDKFVLPQRMADCKFVYRAEPGTGHLVGEETADAAIDGSRYVAIGEILERARHLAGGHAPALVKIDTDGFDALIVEELIGATDCPLFFECDTIRVQMDGGNPWERLFQRMDDEGFSAVVFDNSGLPLLCCASQLATVLRDLSGWIHLQHAVSPVRVHYLDVLALPARCRPDFDALASLVRGDLLKPYGFSR